jgi:hypothetical protein
VHKKCSSQPNGHPAIMASESLPIVSSSATPARRVRCRLPRLTTGVPVVKPLATTGQYHLRDQKRDPNDPNAVEVAAVPNTTSIVGRADNEDYLRRAFTGAK